MPNGSTEIIALSMVASLVVSLAERGFAADNGQGAQLAAMCAACHRLDGHDRGLPSIVGLSEEQFVTFMTAFKSGERSGPIMRTVARSLSNEEIAILARYFVALGKETQRR
jgi:cytochrome subunit of sulfide dehydrogenase